VKLFIIKIKGAKLTIFEKCIETLVFVKVSDVKLNIVKISKAGFLRINIATIPEYLHARG
jgi:hypothetical protein